MLCPKCECANFRTINKEPELQYPKAKDRLYKYRQCDNCGHIWLTIETYLDTNPVVTNVKSKSLPELERHKQKSIKAATELCYGIPVIDRLQEATSSIAIDQIMNAARNRS